MGNVGHEIKEKLMIENLFFYLPVVGCFIFFLVFLFFWFAFLHFCLNNIEKCALKIPASEVVQLSKDSDVCFFSCQFCLVHFEKRMFCPFFSKGNKLNLATKNGNYHWNPWTIPLLVMLRFSNYPKFHCSFIDRKCGKLWQPAPSLWGGEGVQPIRAMPIFRLCFFSLRNGFPYSPVFTEHKLQYTVGWTQNVFNEANITRMAHNNSECIEMNQKA